MHLWPWQGYIENHHLNRDFGMKVIMTQPDSVHSLPTPVDIMRETL